MSPVLESKLIDWTPSPTNTEVVVAAMQPPEPLRSQLDTLGRRLEADYVDAFGRLGGGLNVWFNRTKIGVEVLFPRGRGWDAVLTFGRLSWWPFGRWKQTRTIVDVEKDLRREIDDYLTNPKQC